MKLKLAAGLACALGLWVAPALAQSPDPDYADPGPAYAVAPPAPPLKRATTGLCTIMRGEQVLDQQNCKAMADAPGPDGAGFAGNITYVWPSGNRTVVGGTDDDFSVNGNLAVPLTDTARGLCLRVEKTGNTFCFKEGAKAKIAASPAPAPSPANPKPADTKAPAVAGATIAAPAAAAKEPTLAEQLANEMKLRVAAEDEVKSLKAEVARLGEAEQKRLAELADLRKSEEKKSAEDADRKKAEEKQRAEAALKELDQLKAACAGRDAGACDRALALAKEANVTGSVDSTRIGELQRLRTIALAPLGITSLAFLAEVPPSTWAASSVAAFLALALVVVSTRSRAPETIAYRDGPDASLDLPSPPSLDPFARKEPPADFVFTPAEAEAPARTTPPPIAAFPSLPVHFSAKD